MSTLLYICNPFTRTRQQLTDVDLQKSVGDFKDVVQKQTGIKSPEQELIFMGECLEDDERSLSSYGIEKNVTVFVMEKVKGQDNEDDVDSNTLLSIEEIQALLNKAKKPIYRQSVKKFIKDSEAMEKFITSTDTLKKDFVTCGLLRDADLLIAVIDTAAPEKIAKDYPYLGIALKHIVTKASSISSSSRLPLFQGDEADEYEGLDPALLAQAELMAAGEANVQQQQQQQQSSSQQQQMQQANRHQISASDLANALSFATMTQGGTESATSENESQVEAALVQMQAVGITDEELSRRALSASGGNVEAAINLIYEGNI